MEPEIPSVIDIEDDPTIPADTEPREICENHSVSNNDKVRVAENECLESVRESPVVAPKSSGSRNSRMRLRNVSPKNFGRYQLEYAHWLHMRRHQVAKRRRHVRKHSGVGLAARQPIEVGLARRRPITMRPTKLLRLDSSDRPAIKSAGPATSQAAVSMLRLPRNVVDVETVDAAVSMSDDRGVSDGVRAAIQLHFGAMARIKAGAKCRIMARRWTTDDQLEYLVQWDAGMVT